MNAIDKVRHIQAIMAMSAAEAICYQTWSDDYCRDNIRGAVDRILHHTGCPKNYPDAEPAIGRVDVTELSDDECAILGFNKWTDEPGDKLAGLRLIPLYLYPFLAYGQKLTSIMGETKKVRPGYDVRVDMKDDETHVEFRTRLAISPYIDADHRGGHLAYGFIPTVKSHVEPADAEAAAREIKGEVVTSDGQRFEGVVAREIRDAIDRSA